MPDTEPPSDCPLHGYTENSARHKLERHRTRGDWSQTMRYHAECGQWHVGPIIEDGDE